MEVTWPCNTCRLLEELVPFMDHSIHDPAALRMPGSLHKRKQPTSKVCHQHASAPTCRFTARPGDKVQCWRQQCDRYPGAMREAMWCCRWQL